MHPHPKTTHTQNDLYPVLRYIRKHHYADHPQNYYRDHRQILRALTWPAAWLDKQALTITAEDYNRLLLKKLHQIKLHGDPNHYRAYFPKYLMKALQDHCHHHKEALYQKLKHASYTIDWIAKGIEQNNQHQQTSTLAAAHQLLRQKQRTTKKTSNQITLRL